MSGSWENRDIIFSYLSYFPHDNSSEESIDCCLRVKILSSQCMEFAADIVRSDGVIIVEIDQCLIQAKTIDELLIKINDQSQIACEMIFQQLETFIFET